MLPPPPISTLFPYTTLFRSLRLLLGRAFPVWRKFSRLALEPKDPPGQKTRSEEHTSELLSRFDLVCRLLLEKKNKTKKSLKFLIKNKKSIVHTTLPFHHHSL